MSWRRVVRSGLVPRPMSLTVVLAMLLLAPFEARVQRARRARRSAARNATATRNNETQSGIDSFPVHENVKQVILERGEAIHRTLVENKEMLLQSPSLALTGQTGAEAVAQSFLEADEVETKPVPIKMPSSGDELARFARGEQMYKRIGAGGASSCPGAIEQVQFLMLENEQMRKGLMHIMSNYIDEVVKVVGSAGLIQSVMDQLAGVVKKSNGEIKKAVGDETKMCK